MRWQLLLTWVSWLTAPWSQLGSGISHWTWPPLCSWGGTPASPLSLCFPFHLLLTHSASVLLSTTKQEEWMCRAVWPMLRTPKTQRNVPGKPDVLTSEQSSQVLRPYHCYCWSPSALLECLLHCCFIWRQPHLLRLSQLCDKNQGVIIVWCFKNTNLTQTKSLEGNTWRPYQHVVGQSGAQSSGLEDQCSEVISLIYSLYIPYDRVKPIWFDCKLPLV